MNRRTFLWQGPILLPFLFGEGKTVEPQPTPQPEPFHRDGSSPHYYPFHIFSGEVALDYDKLQTLGTVDNVINAYTPFPEPNPQRAKALYCMYVVHISHPYGNAPYPNEDFSDYLAQPFTHCGPQSYWASYLMRQMGLETRRFWLETHAWVEAKIDGKWEMFDATTNVWISISGEECLQKKERTYRTYYTPWNDREQPTYRQVVAPTTIPLQYTPGALRNHMPGLGIFFYPDRAGSLLALS